MNAAPDGHEEAEFVSSLSDYAQIFMFLRRFGPLLALQPVSLADLEEFFLTRHNYEGDNVAGIHWRLLTSVTRRESRKDWKKMATRFALRSGIIDRPLPYSDISVKDRVELLKLSCEAQFDCNLPFKAELKKLELVSDKPTGMDRSGNRYWLLQDSSYDVRLYRESEYDVQPPEESSWILLARSIDELDVRIADLSGKNARHKGAEEVETQDVEADAMEGNREKTPDPKMELSLTATSRPKREGRRRKIVPTLEAESPESGGCLVCGVDNDYRNMLLCDFCEGECHMYCHYPRLWAVPRGKWECPLCDESSVNLRYGELQFILHCMRERGLCCFHFLEWETGSAGIPKVLVERLRVLHTQLAAARAQLNKATERKQKSVIRLQRTGLLLQNIILSESGTDRSRRSRKVVNYAELNDVYLPPLGPADFIASAAQPSGEKSSSENITHCVGTRASRRLRDLGAESEQYSVNRTLESVDSVGDLVTTAASPAELAKLSPVSSNGTRENSQHTTASAVCGVDPTLEDFSMEDSTDDTSISSELNRDGPRLASPQGSKEDNHPISSTSETNSFPGLETSDLPAVDDSESTASSDSHAICNGLTATADSQDGDFQ